MISTGFKSRLNQLWDSLFTEGISSPVAAIEQLSYLFFIKWLEVTDDPKDSIFEGSYTYSSASGEITHISRAELRWNNLRIRNESERVEFVAVIVFNWLKNESFTHQFFSKHLYNCILLISKPSLLTEAMEAVESAFLSNDEADPTEQYFWDEPAEAYEFLLEKMVNQRSSVVRTPPEIAEMICSLAAPHATDTICDPACGTGEILISVKNYMLRDAQSSRLINVSKNRLAEILTGYEADPVITRLAMMNLMLHGIGNPDISQKSLLVTSVTNEKFSLIISSPPAASISTKDIMEPGSSDTVTTELRFLEELVKLMNIDGRAVILIPENILTDTDAGAVQLRKRLMESCSIDGVLILFAGNVTQYSVNMAILCFAKHQPEDIKKNASQTVWFYETVYQDYSSAVLAYEKRKVNIPANRQGQQFTVPLSEIQNNDFSLSMNLYRRLEQKIQEPGEESEVDTLGIGRKTIAELIAEEKKSEKKSSIYSNLIDTYAQLLPDEHKDLINYIQHLSLDSIINLTNRDKDKPYQDELVNLLQAKKSSLIANATELANAHPYYTLLHQACEEVKSIWNVHTANLLTVAQDNGLQNFTIAQLLDAVLLTKKVAQLNEEQRREAEDQLELGVQTALILFIAKTGKAFTFPTLQKVLAQLQFLPHFMVLRNFIWGQLGQDGFLRQLYIGKEYTVQPVSYNNEFALFETIPGHLHLSFADEFHKLQSQL